MELWRLHAVKVVSVVVNSKISGQYLLSVNFYYIKKNYYFLATYMTFV